MTEAWRDPDWGCFVWCAMTLGARRGELCALQWKHVDLTTSVVTLRRAVSVDESGDLVVKDTKTHQQRRAVIDGIPADLTKAPRAEHRAQAMFEILTSQNRYAILHQLMDAKRPDTRARRIEQFVAMLARGETVHLQRRSLAD